MTMPDANEVRRLVAGIERELPGTIVDCVLDFGSCAKDETPDFSDVDLWVLVHSRDHLVLDQSWEKHERYRCTRDGLLEEYRTLEVMDIDTWGTLVPQLRPALPFMLSCPVADIRWYLWQLANESDWQTFLYLVFAHPYHDSHGFLEQLHSLLWSMLPFHTGPESGIVSTLMRLCEKERDSLEDDLEQIRSGGEVDVPEHARPAWLRYSVECFRDAITVLSFVRDGRPLFRRSDVLRFIECHFPESLEAVAKAYWFKCTSEGREGFTEILRARTDRQVGDLVELTRGITDLWHEALAQVEQAVSDGHSKLRPGGPNWLEENRQVYRDFLKRYLSQFGSLEPQGG